MLCRGRTIFVCYGWDNRVQKGATQSSFSEMTDHVIVLILLTAEFTDLLVVSGANDLDAQMSVILFEEGNKAFDSKYIEGLQYAIVIVVFQHFGIRVYLHTKQWD